MSQLGWLHWTFWRSMPQRPQGCAITSLAEMEVYAMQAQVLVIAHQCVDLLRTC